MLEIRDFFFAIALHVLVVLLIFNLNQWRTEHRPIMEHSIQVQMVSLQALQAMMEAAKPQEKPGENGKPKPRPQPKNKTKPRAVLNPKPQRKRVVEEELDYDPFVPLESKPKRVTKKKASGAQELQTMLQAQLSDKELNRFVAAMQTAVQGKWKVPTEMIGRVKDALVDLQLGRDGHVVKIRIIESSGSAQLDETLIQAIYAAAPFELPDKQFELFRNNQIRFFPLH